MASSAPNRVRRIARVLALPALALALAGSLNGCAGYANYPQIGEDDIAVNNPNVPPVPEAAFTALRWVVRRYPVEGGYTVNLPAGMYRRTGERFIQMLNDPDARLLTPSSQQLPCFHIKRVWVRGERATVEVMRPVLRPPLDIPSGAPSTPLYQSFWVKCEAGWKPWRVVHARAWPIGTDVPPDMRGWPDEPPPPGSKLANPAEGADIPNMQPQGGSAPSEGGSQPASNDQTIEEIPG